MEQQHKADELKEDLRKAQEQLKIEQQKLKHQELIQKKLEDE